MSPKISVIFPVGDRLPFLAEAIESILAQTFTDFELLVVLDGVSEPVRACVASYGDARIRCIDLPLNMGVSNARNVAIAQARAPYLALMDSDDVALPERFARQYAFMQANPQVTVCGSNSIKLLKDGRRVPMRYPQTDGLIKSRLLVVDAAILNPTAMLRSEFVHRHALRYDANFPRDHDHRFYVEMLRQGAVFHGLQEELLLYRRHEGNITQNREGVDEEKTRVREALWPLFFPELTAREARILLRGLCQQLSLDMLEACELVAACNKALGEQRVFFGEDRAELQRQIGQARQRVLSALQASAKGVEA